MKRSQEWVNRLVMRRIMAVYTNDLAQSFVASTGLIPGYLPTEDLSLDGYRLTVPSILSAPWPKYLSLPGRPQS